MSSRESPPETGPETGNNADAASRLRQEAASILQRWEERATPGMAARPHPRPFILLDHLPALLAQMADLLEAGCGGDSPAGQHWDRLPLDLADDSLSQVIHEYGILREVVLDVLESSGSLNKSGRQAILKFVDCSMREAAVHFEALQQAALRQSKEQYSLLVEGAKDYAILLLDANGCVASWNVGAARMTGYREDEILGKPFSLFFIPEDTELRAAQENLEEARIHGSVHSGRWLQRKDGTQYWASGVLTCLPNNGGPDRGFALVMRDASEQRWTAEALEVSEKHYRALIENSLDAMLLLDDRGDIVYASPSTSRILGYAHGDLVGMSGEEMVHPDDREKVSDAFNAMLADATVSARADYRLQHSDGSWRWVEGVAQNLLAEPSIRAVVGHFRDITERKTAEEDLRFVMSHAECLLWHALVEEQHDAEGRPWYRWQRLLFEEEGSQQFLPLPILPGESYATAWYRCKPPEDQKRMDTNAATALREGRRGYANEFRCRRLDGETRWIHEQVVIEQQSEGHWRLAGVCTDITARKQLEEVLRDRAQELAEADQRKDDFMAMLAHELRNPLAPILSAVQILRQPGAQESQLARSRAIIERQVRHQARLLDDLLNISRIARGKLLLRRERLDLSRLVRSVVEDYRGAAETAHLTIAVECPQEPVWVDGDPTRLSQIVSNLFNNAVKYTDSGGAVSVRVLPDLAPGRAQVEVEDTGIGIPPEMLPHVFDLFAQAEQSLKRSAGGLGLGLALVKGLVALHKGEVTASSAGQGQGSCFRFWLPTQSSPAGIPETLAPPALDSAALRVLIIDDNHDAADTLRDLIEMWGHEVRVAYFGRPGLDLARSFQPHVVFSDLGLPDLDGYTVAVTLREDPDMRGAHLVAVSGYGTDEDRVRASGAGFDLHLTKPVEPEDLRKLLAGLSVRGPGES